MLMLKNKLIYSLPVLLFASPVLAHNVKTQGNVASTFHIEPNHNPRAGEPSQAWFALTKPGGEVISLDRCNCQLQIISNHEVPPPPLKAISAEQYKGIPGAEIIFPKAGIYKLEISGTPKTAGDFNEFKFAYEVTVQAGATAQQTSSAPIATQPTQNSTGWILPIATGAIVLLTGAWIVKRTVKN
jgi:hypothetical protein